jgi:hypothetical protein
VAAWPSSTPCCRSTPAPAQLFLGGGASRWRPGLRGRSAASPLFSTHARLTIAGFLSLSQTRASLSAPAAFQAPTHDSRAAFCRGSALRPGPFLGPSSRVASAGPPSRPEASSAWTLGDGRLKLQRTSGSVGVARGTHVLARAAAGQAQLPAPLTLHTAGKLLPGVPVTDVLQLHRWTRCALGSVPP